MYKQLTVALIAAAMFGCDGNTSSVSTESSNETLQNLIDPGNTLSKAALTAGYVQIPAAIEAEDYVSQNGIRIGQTSDSGGSDYIGWVNNGDHTEYTINVPQTGIYYLEARVANKNQVAQIGFSVNGNVQRTMTVNPTGGWDSWQTLSVTLPLTAGDQNFRLEYSGSTSSYLLNINWFSLQSTGNTAPPETTTTETPTPETPTQLPTDDSELDNSNWIVSSNFNTDDAYLAIDGNDSTRWTTRIQQTNGQDFYIDMRGNQTFDRIVLDTTQSSIDFPRSYQVNVSSNNSDWSEVAAGTGTSYGPTVIDFADQTKRYVKISQLASSGGHWWSIHELSVYANSSDETPEPPTNIPPEPSTSNTVDVYMVTGQSNVKEDWSSAIEARLKLLNSDRDSVVVMNRHPGNSLNSWWTSGPEANYRSDLTMLQQAFDDLENNGKEPRLNGFFWFQGESDLGSRDQMALYSDRFKSFTTEFFNEMNTSNVPVAIAVIDTVPSDTANEIMRGIHFDLGNELNGFAFDTRGYERSDGLHLTSSELQRLGNDMAEKFYYNYLR